MHVLADCEGGRTCVDVRDGTIATLATVVLLERLEDALCEAKIPRRAELAVEDVGALEELRPQRPRLLGCVRLQGRRHGHPGAALQCWGTAAPSTQLRTTCSACSVNTLTWGVLLT